jgi:hypothetical protein
MRRPILLAGFLIACWFSLPVTSAMAQYGGPGGGGGGGGHGGGGAPKDTSADDAAQKKKDDEWNVNNNLALPGKQNSGPCPYVKVLYDAGRYVEFKDAKVAASAVGYTGEFEGLSSGCEYTGVKPIHVAMELLFAFGRGPDATGSSKVYRYWVAVTDRNQAVLAKQYFDVRADFPPGKDRVMVTDHINGLVIPRADSNVSGSNFEVLIGFDVTPEMADFNRLGKRFHVNAGGPTTTTAQASQTGTPAQQ